MTYMTNTPNESTTTLKNIWGTSGIDNSYLEWVNLSGEEPVLPSMYKVGLVSQSAVAATGLAAAAVWHRRTGQQQYVTVDMKQSTIAFRSERYTSINGSVVHKPVDDIHGFYQCGDGGWIQLHANYPAHRSGIVTILQCESNRTDVQRELDKVSAFQAEGLFTENGLPAGMMRTLAEWSKHPQGIAVSGLPLLEIDKIGDSPPLILGDNPERPLDSVKVVELTKVIAGPLIGRTLAEHGAEVLWLNSPHLDLIEGLVIDMSRGKNTANIDIRQEEGKSKLRELIGGADIFVQGYRPGSIASKGFSFEDIAEIKPGIIYVELSAFSHEGPWSHRRGFDSIVQTVSGIGREGAKAIGEDGMLHLPCQALDHATGYLGAFGAMAALIRRSEEGGSWRVRVSLAQTAEWLKSLGILNRMDIEDFSQSQIKEFMCCDDSSYGRISYTCPAAILSRTPGYWDSPPSSFGTHQPEWRQA